jgi:hypothetical protein
MLKNVSYKNIFLIDGMGAVLTALLLSQLLARLVPVFGMPSAILYPLAAIAACFAIYSLLCHLLVKKNWKPFLRGIAVANTLYCLTTLGWVIYLWNSLTWLGIAYFLGEILIVMTLVRVEIKMSHKDYRT